MILLVNFGGPRSLDEVEPFLKALFTDRDVIRTRFPNWLHRFIFQRVAKKRAIRVRKEYAHMGGRSPIYEDTETLARLLAAKTGRKVVAFHRYLPETHAAITEPALVLPLFPQFSYATTGSIARLLARHTNNRLLWLKSYAAHPAFIRAYAQRVRSFLQQHNLLEEETILLCSAHGLPKSFIDEGDPYETECQLSFRALLSHFPRAHGHLAYQSKVGTEEWLTPATEVACKQIPPQKNAIIVPITFTSDHIETLVEIEQQYIPLLAQRGMRALRCPALNLESYWIDALAELAQETNLCTTQMLIRNVKPLYIPNVTQKTTLY